MIHDDHSILTSVEKERHASWLELFYDLVFATAVSQIGLTLHDNTTSVTAFLGNVALFVPVMWAWVGLTFYSARFETDDLFHRLLVFLQMMGAAALTINIHGALAETSDKFAISYAVIRILLVVEYIRAGRKIPAASKFARGYAQGFLISAMLWLISAAIPIPFRFIIWLLAIAIDIATTFIVGRKHVQLAPNFFHLPERMGLFTLIVIGETIFGLVSILSSHEWDLESTISMGAGLSIAFGLWWLYFDNTDGAPIRAFRQKGRIRIYITWLYVHFPLVIGLVCTATGIRYIVSATQNIVLSYAGEWLICGSVSLCLVSIGVIQFTIASASRDDEDSGDSSISHSNRHSIRSRKILIQGSVYRFLAGFVILLIPILAIPILPLPLILIISVICAIEIVIDIRHHPHHRIF
jgi:low temperature requirement protein LtrA